MRLVRQGGPTARLARLQVEAWQSILRSLPDGGRALAISHGRVIECGTVACFPDAGHAAWGPPFRHCEGMRLTAARDVLRFDLLRVEQAPAV